MKILVVKLSSLGDIVHALPVVDVFFRSLPKASVHWLVERSFSDILSLHPLIKKVISVDTRGWRKHPGLHTLREVSSVVKALRRERYDVVVDLQGNSKSGLFTLLSGAAKRYGWPLNIVREWPNVLATNRKIGSARYASSIRERLIFTALEICKSLSDGIPDPFSPGCQAPLKPPAPYLERQLNYFRSFGVRPGALLIGIQPGTTWETKRWFVRGWEELIGLLTHHYGAQGRDVRIVVFWGREEEFFIARRLMSVNPQKVILWKGGNLLDLAGGIYFMSLFIGPDTGPVHLAALLGVPTLSIYRATSAARNAPESNGFARHIALQSPLPCSPCLKKFCPDNPSCEESIKPCKVFQCALELLAERTGFPATP